MSKLKTIFRCQQCGFCSVKWLGQCPDCGKWNTFVEEVEEITGKTVSKSKAFSEFSSDVIRLSEAKLDEQKHIPVGITELDRVLGGGTVPGQVVLLAGPPGIGKSTLMLQAACSMAQTLKTLYISGEESLGQVMARAKRLGIKSEEVYILSETNLGRIIESLNKIKPSVLIIDSIQTTFHPEFAGSPGSVGQIRECATELLRISKTKDMRLFILGHITKEGFLAGPKVLEHIVDTVLYFDIERNQLYRILRSHKNRFGPTSEVGIFEMTETGLEGVSDSSKILANISMDKSFSGRAFSMATEGTRTILIEIQALVSSSYFPYPRRMVTGIDLNRAQVLLAAIEKNLHFKLQNMDVFATLQGGMKIKDPAVDMAFCASIISSAKDLMIPPDCVFIGEVGILGQVSTVPMMPKRIAEADRLGFKKAYISKLPENPPFSAMKSTTIKTIFVEDIKSLYSILMKFKSSPNS